MAKSRGRKGKQHRARRSAPRLSAADWEMVELMQAANEAEARGDAGAALAIMDSRPVGPDGKPFWRPERVRRLDQLEMLESYLPRWVTSRWILAQAMQMMEPSQRSAHQKALAIAVELRGGAAELPGCDEVDALVKVTEHDWVFRQLMLYEFGGVAVFLRRAATPDLVAGADRIHDWVCAPMRVLRFCGRSRRTSHWSDVVTGEALEVLDLGSAALVLPQECVLGRLVPTGDGTIFEGMPLRVPDDIAVAAAADPSRWLEALQRGTRVERSKEEEFTTSILCDTSLLTDLPDLVWQLAVLQYAGHTGANAITAENVAEATFVVVHAVLAGGIEAGQDDLDPWSCISAALVHPVILERVDGAFAMDEAPALRRLADRLVGPAAEICLDLASSARGVA